MPPEFLFIVSVVQVNRRQRINIFVKFFNIEYDAQKIAKWV